MDASTNSKNEFYGEEEPIEAVSEAEDDTRTRTIHSRTDALKMPSRRKMSLKTRI
jgi:hypothetical protein